jgi:hypothetical protein
VLPTIDQPVIEACAGLAIVIEFNSYLEEVLICAQVSYAIWRIAGSLWVLGLTGRSQTDYSTFFEAEWGITNSE